MELNIDSILVHILLVIGILLVAIFGISGVITAILCLFSRVVFNLAYSENLFVLAIAIIIEMFCHGIGVFLSNLYTYLLAILYFVIGVFCHLIYQFYLKENKQDSWLVFMVLVLVVHYNITHLSIYEYFGAMLCGLSHASVLCGILFRKAASPITSRQYEYIIKSIDQQVDESEKEYNNSLKTGRTERHLGRVKARAKAWQDAVNTSKRAEVTYSPPRSLRIYPEKVDRMDLKFIPGSVRKFDRTPPTLNSDPMPVLVESILNKRCRPSPTFNENVKTTTLVSRAVEYNSGVETQRQYCRHVQLINEEDYRAIQKSLSESPDPPGDVGSGDASYKLNSPSFTLRYRPPPPPTPPPFTPTISQSAKKRVANTLVSFGEISSDDDVPLGSVKESDITDTSDEAEDYTVSRYLRNSMQQSPLLKPFIYEDSRREAKLKRKRAKKEEAIKEKQRKADEEKEAEKASRFKKIQKARKTRIARLKKDGDKYLMYHPQTSWYYAGEDRPPWAKPNDTFPYAMAYGLVSKEEIAEQNRQFYMEHLRKNKHVQYVPLPGLTRAQMRYFKINNFLLKFDYAIDNFIARVRNKFWRVFGAISVFLFGD